MITFKSKKEVQTAEDVFAEMNARQVAALMLHDQMANYFAFLGLSGYKRLHEHQYQEEGKERRKLNRYYITRHKRLIPERFEGTVSEIPEAWWNANAMSVGRSTKQKAVEDGFNAYREREEETKELYSHYSKRLREMGQTADALYVDKIVEKVDEELENLDKIILALISTGYDMVYVVESQKKIHEHYKKREGD